MLKKDFLERFSISESEFREAGLSWDDLCYIAKDYARRLPDLRRIRDEFLQEFIKNKDQRTGLHSYRTRVKTHGIWLKRSSGNDVKTISNTAPLQKTIT